MHVDQHEATSRLREDVDAMQLRDGVAEGMFGVGGGGVRCCDLAHPAKASIEVRRRELLARGRGVEGQGTGVSRKGVAGQ